MSKLKVFNNGDSDEPDEESSEAGWNSDRCIPPNVTGHVTFRKCSLYSIGFMVFNPQTGMERKRLKSFGFTQIGKDANSREVWYLIGVCATTGHLSNMLDFSKQIGNLHQYVACVVDCLVSVGIAPDRVRVCFPPAP